MWKSVVERWQINAEAGASDMEAKQPYVDNGLEIMEPSRYFDRSFMQLEWERVWTRAWLIAGIETDIPEAGDYSVFRVGRESIPLVRQQDGSVKAMYNVCAHRGNLIAQNDRGSAKQFTCAGLIFINLSENPLERIRWRHLGRTGAAAQALSRRTESVYRRGK